MSPVRVGEVNEVRETETERAGWQGREEPVEVSERPAAYSDNAAEARTRKTSDGVRVATSSSSFPHPP